MDIQGLASLFHLDPILLLVTPPGFYNIINYSFCRCCMIHWPQSSFLPFLCSHTLLRTLFWTAGHGNSLLGGLVARSRSTASILSVTPTVMSPWLRSVL